MPWRVTCHDRRPASGNKGAWKLHGPESAVPRVRAKQRGSSVLPLATRRELTSCNLSSGGALRYLRDGIFISETLFGHRPHSPLL